LQAKAFTNLFAFNVNPKDFNPQNADGSPYTSAAGVGLWQSAKIGHFGGGAEWAQPPIAFAPNPTQCVFIGPKVSDFACNTCGLGYETASATNTTCIKPLFKPYRG